MVTMNDFYRSSKKSSVYHPGDRVKEVQLNQIGVVIGRDEAKKSLGRLKLSNLHMPVQLETGGITTFRMGCSVHWAKRDQP